MSEQVCEVKLSDGRGVRRHGETRGKAAERASDFAGTPAAV
jgi:hypothetical protein